MESIIVHPKNPMEMSALKTMLKDMGIKFEKFHTNNFQGNKTTKKPIEKKNDKTTKPYKPKGL